MRAMIGGRTSNIVVVFGIAIFVAILVLVVLSEYSDFADFCPLGEVPAECAREWFGAAGGWIAAVAAMITVLTIYHQTIDGRRRIEEETLRDSIAVANVILVDLLDTRDRVQSAKSELDLDPPWSASAQGLVRDAMNVHPALGAVLRTHCSEVGALRSRIQKVIWNSQIAGPGPSRETIDGIAFRAHVLSWCFGVASSQLSKQGNAPGPFISRKRLTSFEQLFNVDDAELRYLERLFSVSGYLPDEPEID